MKNTTSAMTSIVLVRVAIVIMNHYDQKQLGEKKSCFADTSMSLFVIEGS